MIVPSFYNLRYPSGLSSIHQSFVDTNGGHFDDVFWEYGAGTVGDEQSWVSIDYISDVSGCIGEHIETYYSPTDINKVLFDGFHFPQDSFGNNGEFSVRMKSNVFSSEFGSTVPYYYILWLSDGFDYNLGVHLGVGIKIEIWSTYNGGRMQSPQKLIINDSKNYIYSGGIRTTI